MPHAPNLTGDKEGVRLARLIIYLATPGTEALSAACSFNRHLVGLAGLVTLPLVPPLPSFLPSVSGRPSTL